MEEAIVDVALDLNLPPPEQISQEEAQQDTRLDHRDQVPSLATVSQVEQASSPIWSEEQQSSPSPDYIEELSSLRPQNRAARVETLRQHVANGTYSIDSAQLAHCILRNSTHVVETC